MKRFLEICHANSVANLDANYALFSVQTSKPIRNNSFAIEMNRLFHKIA